VPTTFHSLRVAAIDELTDDAVAVTFEVPPTLAVPQVAAARTGGRRGEHTEDLVAMLEDMQGLARAHPGATW